MQRSKEQVLNGVRILRSWVLLAVALAFAPLPGGAQTIDSDRRLAQFHHRAWTIADGAPPDIWAIQQTPDGFLWLGTGAGLYRFDGIRFERIQPTSGDKFPFNNIVSLLALPSGDLWIGYQNGGVSRLRDGRLTNFNQGLPNGSILQLNADQSGAIWAVAQDDFSESSIGRFVDGKWEVIGREWGAPETTIRGLEIDRHGVVWLSAPGNLLRLPPGGRRFEPTGISVSDEAKLVEGPDGRLWSTERVYGTRVLRKDGKRPAARDVKANYALRMVFDRHGALWGTSGLGGLFRVAPPDVAAADGTLAEINDRFGVQDGLSSSIAKPLLEDREGNIWVGTNLGLDRFSVVAVVAQTDVPQTSRDGYRAAIDGDGGLIVADSNSLWRVGKDQVTRLIARGQTQPKAMCQGANGSVWISNEHLLRRMDNGRDLTTIALPLEIADSSVLSCQEDSRGGLWLSIPNKGLFRRTEMGWSRIKVRGQKDERSPYLVVADRQGRMWLKYPHSPLVMIDGRLVRRFGRAEGLDVGEITIVQPRTNGVLVGGDHGIARFDGKRFQTLASTSDNPIRRIAGIAETPRGDTWLNGIAGIVRVATRDLDAAFDGRSETPGWQVFDFQDGLTGLAQQDSYAQTAIAAPDGRVWFITNHGIVWINPAALPRNTVPPPVVIRSLRANGKAVPIGNGMKLAEGTSNLQIDYTALSLAVPERVRFRYRLDGVDASWVDPGERRQAFYTKLGPGSYVFNVIASNNDGVWNTKGAKLAFEIRPTFVQTDAFRALVLIGVAALVWLLYSIRLKQMSARIRARLEERLGERERIARELHDTLLQGLQGLMLRFQAATEHIPHEQPARAMMETALDQADQVLVESRDSVRGLRTTAVSTDLAQVFLAAASQARSDPRVRFDVVSEGRPRALHPAVAAEISRIGCEAIINAFRHAGASRIDVNIAYRRDAFSLRIVDDGVGIGDTILDRGREGHFGLTGMRERAALIKADFTLSSRAGAGTEVALHVPARFAYTRARTARWPGRRWRG